MTFDPDNPLASAFAIASEACPLGESRTVVISNDDGEEVLEVTVHRDPLNRVTVTFAGPDEHRMKDLWAQLRLMQLFDPEAQGMTVLDPTQEDPRT